ncbi:SsgA family sporulation/cell division regulator [Streptomyces sp. NPDC101249]|uniref:SsgA family sporulation/cell division regulator n=1 Tax=Streptomyces sp. NPDC101249 TaxID=3366140 RepID=UPI0037FA2B14
MHIALEQPTGAHLVIRDGQELPIPLTLRYTSDDPLAVHADFPAHVSVGDEKVTWTFARALLEEGLDAPAGVGNVHIRPAGPRRTVVELHAPEGVAMVCFDTPVLRRFLTRSHTVVEPGGEQIGAVLDDSLTAMFGAV